MARHPSDSPARDTPCKRPAQEVSHGRDDTQPTLKIQKARLSDATAAKRQSRYKSKLMNSTSTKKGWCHWSGHGWFIYDPGASAECPTCHSIRQREMQKVINLPDVPRRPAWWEKSTGNYTWSAQEWANGEQQATSSKNTN